MQVATTTVFDKLCVNTRCGEIIPLVEMSDLKLMRDPGSYAWSRYREGILKFC